jgi:hypothetical protein
VELFITNLDYVSTMRSCVFMRVPVVMIVVVVPLIRRLRFRGRTRFRRRSFWIAADHHHQQPRGHAARGDDSQNRVVIHLSNLPSNDRRQLFRRFD